MSNKKTSALPHALNLTHLLHTPLSIDFVLPGLKRKTVGALISPGGTGKSYWALALAVAFSGHPAADLTGLAPKGGRVLMLSGEDDEDVVGIRLKAMANALPGRMEIAHLDYRSCVGLRIDILNDDWYDAIQSQARGARLVILDTLSRFHQLDENSAQDMNKVMAKLEQLAADSGAAVLYLHHTSKSAILNGQGGLQQAARGSSVLVDNARWAAFLAVMSEGEARLLGIKNADRMMYVRWNISKQNYSAPQPDRWFRRDEGGVLLPVKLGHHDTSAPEEATAPLTEATVPESIAMTPPFEIKKELNEVLSRLLPTATNAFEGEW